MSGPACTMRGVSNFLIYGLIDPLTDELRYIGKSARGMARPREHSAPYGLKRQSNKTRWIASLLAAGVKPTISVIAESANAGELAAMERAAIAKYRAAGCRLLNLTDGGEGTLNPAAHHRAAIRASNAAREWTKAARSAIADANSARTHTQESRDKRRQQRLGRKWAPEVKAKIASAHKGKVRSAAHSAAISAAKKGKPVSPERRAFLSAVLAKTRGRPHTAESKAKLAAARIGKPWTPAQRMKILEGKRKAAEERAINEGVHCGRPAFPGFGGGGAPS